ncbi:hypothetical protein [Fibrella aestuarina]|uniref:hypothetical protein n=1 Tax=Fibrella aestuarina TaxID=651143 RepID=UPI00059E82C7|nr:hypothetical protein [Fibrella aestuarina]
MLQIGFDIVFTSLCGLMLLAAYRNIFHQNGSDFAPAAVDPVPSQKETPADPSWSAYGVDLNKFYTQYLCGQWDEHYSTTQKGSLVVAGKVGNTVIWDMSDQGLDMLMHDHAEVLRRGSGDEATTSLMKLYLIHKATGERLNTVNSTIADSMLSVKHPAAPDWWTLVDRHIAHLRSGYFAPIPSQFLASLNTKAAYRLTDLSARILLANDNLVLRSDLIDEYHDLLKAVFAEQPRTTPYSRPGEVVAQRPSPVVHQ